MFKQGPCSTTIRSTRYLLDSIPVQLLRVYILPIDLMPMIGRKFHLVYKLFHVNCNQENRFFIN